MQIDRAAVTIAAANVKIERNKAANLRKYVAFIEEAADKNVDLLVFPEMGLQGYADLSLPPASSEAVEQGRYFVREAETIPGPMTERIQEYASVLGMYIQVGLAEVTLGGNKLFNSTVLIGREGIVSVHRKTHNQFEHPYFASGGRIQVAETPFARVASAICSDICFPEYVRVCALKGAEIILVSTAWPMKAHDRDQDYYGRTLDLSARANAFFNQVWVVVSNHCEKNVYSTHLDYYGNSQIIHPRGDVTASSGEEEGLVLHTANIRDELLRARTRDFFCTNLVSRRRVELYGTLTEGG